MKSTLNIRGNLYTIEQAQVMGILNVTPDSFYDGGYYQIEKKILQQAEKMLLEGADWLDVGGYSSRPQADDVSVEEELRRVVPAIAQIKKQFPESRISVDTFRAKVAQEAVNAGADMINDISGGSIDEAMFPTVAQLQVPYILMHMRGTPQTMQQHTQYEHILVEILSYFQEKIAILVNLGVNDIIVDLGLGFAKTLEQNYQLLAHLSYFQKLNKPILIGASRKSMIYKLLETTPQEALNGTTVLHTIALTNGANFLRVHDVREAVEVVKIVQQLNHHHQS